MSTTTASDLVEVRGNAPERNPNVRTLAAFADHTDCALAALGFAAKVDFDRLMVGTDYEAPFGQSPFAFARGLSFERRVAADGYAPVLSLLREHLGFSEDAARVVNLREGFQRNRKGLRERAIAGRDLIAKVVHGHAEAPNLIDGLVLTTSLGGIEAFFEADNVAAAEGGPIRPGEIKSYPVVDGRADPDKVGATLDQLAVYSLLLAEVIVDVGGDPREHLSSVALLITPKNVGLTPTMSTRDISRQVRRTERLLARLPDPTQLAAAVPAGVSFGSIADTSTDANQRIDTFHRVADGIGTAYKPSCLSSCGAARLCRERAFGAGSPCVSGTQNVRLLPGVRSLSPRRRSHRWRDADRNRDPSRDPTGSCRPPLRRSLPRSAGDPEEAVGVSSQLDAALAARAHRDGNALRTASLRHRRLVDSPLAVVLWQLGAEPFSAAAMGYGTTSDDFGFAVAGEPRNRDLAFRLLLELAEWFNPRFEAPAEHREQLPLSKKAQPAAAPRTRALTAPQVIVANHTTIELLGRLGRRLAYLPIDGEYAAPPQLVRLGRHLLFLHRESTRPGQQLVVAMTELVQHHWATSLSPLEAMSLPALDAFIDPSKGQHGFHAAAAAERISIGPNPTGEDDNRLMPLVEQFNEQRGGSTEVSRTRRLLGPLEDHYRPLVRATWDLIWRCRGRELGYSEAPSVAGRWSDDRDAYTRHVDWMATVGRYRTRQTALQAAMTMDAMERAKQRVVTEEACDDPARMIPYLLDNKAVHGTVVSVDTNYKEVAAVRAVRRPLVTVAPPDRCIMPIGKKLYWTREPAGPEWLVHRIVERADGGTDVVLKRTSGTYKELPTAGGSACFSILTLPTFYDRNLPRTPPWTHTSRQADEPASIESDDGMVA